MDLAGYGLERSAGLADAILDFESRVDAPVYVVTLPSIGAPKSAVKNYAMRLFNEWRIGFDGSQQGVLIIIVKDVRRIEIEVGQRLNAVVSHSWTPRMIENDVTPRLKEGNYPGGVEKAVRRLAARIENNGQSGLPDDWYMSPRFWVSAGKTIEAEDALKTLGIGVGVVSFATAQGVIAYRQERWDRTCESCGSVVTQVSKTQRRVGEWKTVKHATEQSSGKRVRTLRCHKCGAITEKVRIIPRIIPASERHAGGGGYDGGGYSDGGGGGGGDF